MTEPWLHDHKEFADLVQIVSDEQGISSELIEKDYWIMHCLWGLEQRYSFELKGGTSLSKGYKIIDRFSEDIDIRVEPPVGMEVKTGKNQDRPPHRQSRETFFGWLAGDITIPGIVSVDRDRTFDDTEMRNAGIRLRYPSPFQRARSATKGVLKEGVLLEVGFDETTPNRELAISSWVVDYALAKGASIGDNRAKRVRCYSPAYTFVEKLQTISTKFRRQQSGGGMPSGFLRHYYDIYQLLACEEVRQFVGTQAYHERKRKRFRRDDNLNIAQNEAFLLTDPQVRRQYAEEYKKSADLYYRGQAPFEDILARIRENLGRL